MRRPTPLRRFVLMLSLLSVIQAAWAQTLWQVWRKAVSHDPQFVVDKERFEALSEREPAALGALLPRLSLGAGAQVDNGRMVAPQLAGNGQSTYLYSAQSQSRYLDWQLILTQSIFDWGTLQDYRASEYQVLAAAAEYQAARQALAVRVVRFYVQWLADEADRRVLMEARRGFDRELHIMQSEYGAGTVGILGSEEARVALERVQAQVLQAQSRLAGARLALEAVTGRPVSRRAPALPEKFDPPVMYSAVRWRRLAGRHNPLLASARALRHAASREVSGALGGLFAGCDFAVRASAGEPSRDVTVQDRRGAVSRPGFLPQSGELGRARAILEPLCRRPEPRGSCRCRIPLSRGHGGARGRKADDSTGHCR